MYHSKKSNLKYEIMKVKLHRTVQNITYYTKLPAVITALDSTLYHCHQQGFSPKYRRIVFFLIIFFSIQKTKHITWYSIVTWSLLEAEIKVATRDVIAVRRLRRQMDVYQYTGFPKIALAFPSNFTEKADDSCTILR